jgi:uncharacterized membrane protein YdbT with pleckstrin-like domain
LTSNSNQTTHSDVVWYGKPWVVSAAIVRTITVILLSILFLSLEFFSGGASAGLLGLPVWAWTLLAFSLIWLVNMLELLVFRATNTYELRQDGLEVKRGILKLHSFVVTPPGFGDLLVCQSIGGRIFGYGELTVNSLGGRETKLRLVRSPAEVAGMIQDVMGKPIVGVEGRV